MSLIGNSYSVLPAATPEAEGALTIAIPSRLHFPPTTERPFNGLRICLKDNINLKGVKTTGASRSFGQAYPPVEASAPVVQWLIELGAVIVGKTVLSQFASTGAPTGDYPEFLCGFNARGDRYRTPGGSSSGSGAAIGSYPWLDLALGTDSESTLSELHSDKLNKCVSWRKRSWSSCDARSIWHKTVNHTSRFRGYPHDTPVRLFDIAEE